MIKCERPEWLKNFCIFQDVIVNGKKRRYYMDSISSKKDILYIRGNGIWKIENEQIWIENALCKK